MYQFSILKEQQITIAHKKIAFSFQLENHTLTLLKGRNGIGKTSLINYIKMNYLSLNNQLIKEPFPPLFLSQSPLTALPHLRGIDLLHTLQNHFKDQIMCAYIENHPLVVDLNFRDQLYLPISSLSGGENQKLKIISLFFLTSPLYILDEPFAHLDKKSISVLSNFLLEIKKRSTLLIVEHQLKKLNHLCDQTLHLKEDKEHNLIIEVLS